MKWIWVLGLIVGAVVVRGEDDAMSYDERLTPDGEETLLPSHEFSGDVLVRAREVRPPGSTYQSAPDSLKNNLYLYQRTRLSYGPVEASWLAKRASVGPAVSLDNFRSYGTLKGSVGIKEWGPVTRLVAGNYSLSFGQGLMFYDGFGEFVRPVAVHDAGPRPDTTSGANDHLRGAAGRFHLGKIGTDIIVSEKPLDFPLNPDGTVDADLSFSHENTGDVQTAADLENNNTVTERLSGGRLFWEGETLRAGVSGARIDYSRSFSPSEKTFAGARSFRGDALTLWGGNADVRWRAFRGVAEIVCSASPEPAWAWTSTLLWNGPGQHYWLGIFDYDPHFITPHGKGVAFGVSGAPDSLTSNQQGGLLGGEWSKGPWKGRANVTAVRFPEAKGDGRDSEPVAPSVGRYLLLDQRWRIYPDWEIRGMFQGRGVEKRLDDPVTGTPRPVETRTEKWRATAQWRVTSKMEWTIRRDWRVERTPAFGEISSGKMWVADVDVDPWPGGKIKTRAYFFDSPQAYLTTGPEEIWDGVVYDRLAGNLGNLRGEAGTRMYLIFRQKWCGLQLWGKYEITRRPVDAEGRSDSSAAAKRAWHLQMSLAW